MSTIYGKLNSSEQQFGGTCPQGYVLMQFPRPDGDYYVAKEDGTWEQSQELRNEQIKKEILFELDEIDRKSARPMRAKLANKATADDENLLIELEDKAVILRAELSSLTMLSQGV